MAQRKMTAHLFQTEAGFHTTLVAGNRVDVAYTSETIETRTGALKSPKALKDALQPYYVDHTGDIVVKRDWATGKIWQQTKA